MNDAEQERQNLLKQIRLDLGENPQVKYGPGTFGCHELLDRTALILRLLEDEIIKHPSCILQPEWFALAREATTVVCHLYQKIGGEHLETKPVKP